MAPIVDTQLTGEQAVIAAEAARVLSSSITARRKPTVGLSIAGNQLVVPTAAVELFIDVLASLARGQAVVVLPREVELSTQQAADLLNVSRPYVVGLIEGKKLPARKVGTRRRVLLSDVMAYKHREDQQRGSVMRELAQQAQELDLGY